MSIKYHGTPISGTRVDTAMFFRGRNRHALIPFFRQDDLNVALMYCTTVVFDTSAYSLFKSGNGDYDQYYSAYVEWVRQYYRHPRFAWCIIPDVIGGSEAENEAYLVRWPEDLKHVGVPVWHMNESLTRLLRLCQNYPRVALAQGSHKGSVTARLDEAMEHICDANGQPICKLHGLKMQDPKLFSKYPFASTDSTNAAQNNHLAYKNGKHPTLWECTDDIAYNVEIKNSAAAWKRKPAQKGLFDFLQSNAA